MVNQHYIIGDIVSSYFLAIRSPKGGKGMGGGTYQCEEELCPPIGRTGFREDGDSDGPSQEDDETLDCVKDDFQFLKEVL